MNKSQKKEEAYAFVSLLFYPGSDKSVVKKDLKNLILSCGYSEPIEALFRKCWSQWDTLTSNYFSGQDSSVNTVNTFNAFMSAVSFIDLRRRIV